MFHRDISEIEQRYQGRLNEAMLLDYCWFMYKDAPDAGLHLVGVFLSTQDVIVIKKNYYTFIVVNICNQYLPFSPYTLKWKTFTYFMSQDLDLIKIFLDGCHTGFSNQY